MAKKDVNNEKKKNNFSKELKSEMKKVTWPTFKELVSSTSAVISIVIMIAAIVFVLDVCFENLNEFGIEKLKSLVSNKTTQQENENSSEGENTLDTQEDTNVVEPEVNPETNGVTMEPEQNSTENVVQ